MIETLVKTLEQKLGFVVNGGVRVRFAPSPTGYFHIGSARTALFNYLFAKKNKGKFVLRIEDTDTERSKKEYEEDIIESLEWLGIDWDEGPYRQSERKDIYRKYLEKLLEEGKAYHCFCSPEELEAERQERMSRGEAPIYNGKCSKLSKEEAEERIKKGEKSIIRFKVINKKISFNDMVRGTVEFDTSLIGDVSIAKDLETPLYNFSVVVDDYEMKITHIVRGEDLMPNTPKQILIQEALGFNPVIYGHLPLILGSDRSKLSKRDGATSLREYRDIGYLPEAMINFLAFLGWNPGTEKEIFSLNSLKKEFSIDKVQKSGAVFNEKKLEYINGFYIRHKSLDSLTEDCIPYLIKSGLINPVLKSEQIPATFGGKSISYDYVAGETGENVDREYIKKTVSLYQERLKRLSEISELVDCFFKEKLEYDGGLLIWKEVSKEEIKSSIDKSTEILSKIEKWEEKEIEKKLMVEAEKTKDRGRVLWPVRVALTGKKSSAGPFEIAAVLGKEKTLKRLKEASAKL